SAKDKASRDRESVCPWESTDIEHHSLGYSRESTELPKATKRSESTGSTRAEVCPWESMDTELPPEQPRARSPVLPKPPSRKPQSQESLKAEVCPWEAPGAEAGGKAAVEKGSSERESVCPWESLGTEQPLEQPRARSPALPKSPSRKPQSQESLKAEVCPWELEPTDKARICPWEVAAPLPERGEAPGEVRLPPTPAQEERS
ncbi:GP179 protein, partial [Zapornia atra]|nr:GP179 protein [Zapornia atra]